MQEKQVSTPLHLAAQFGHNEIVDYLVKKNANIFAKDHDGLIPASKFPTSNQNHGSMGIDPLKEKLICKVFNCQNLQLKARLLLNKLNSVVKEITKMRNLPFYELSDEDVWDFMIFFVTCHSKILKNPKAKDCYLYLFSRTDVNVVKVIVDHLEKLDPKDKYCGPVELIQALEVICQEIPNGKEMLKKLKYSKELYEKLYLLQVPFLYPVPNYKEELTQIKAKVLPRKICNSKRKPEPEEFAFDQEDAPKVPKIELKTEIKTEFEVEETVFDHEIASKIPKVEIKSELKSEPKLDDFTFDSELVEFKVELNLKMKSN